MHSTPGSKSLRPAARLMVIGILPAGGLANVCAAESSIPLFNGTNLDGWTPKIRGFEFGGDPARIFQVTNGAICVRYESYKNFDSKFGHLFYKEPFTNYILRVEYRFVGDQVPGGPDWAIRNSGIRIHCQDPATMRRDQDFPVSIEVQLPGGNGQ